MASIAANVGIGITHPRFRLRHLLIAALAALLGMWGVPRARAAWRLHDTATLYADYGLCMAGPTGATLLRDQPSEFWRLVRRRLVASGADEKVFAGCGPTVARLTGASHAADLHQARAGEFAEWGRTGGGLQLSDLARTLPDLATLSDSAWPFLKNGVSVLIKPSLGAKEAIHPVESARPGSLNGLRLHGSLFRTRRTSDKGWFVVLSDADGVHAYRSRDRGHRWTATSAWQTALENTHERCSAEASERAFGLEPHRAGAAATIVYFNHGMRSGQSTLGEGQRVLNLACDDAAAVIIVESGRGQLGLTLCAMEQPCKAMPILPILNELRPDGIDLARIQGATVIALTQGDLVRVVSTRDDGRVYTPFTVALDHNDNPFVPKATFWPAQLLAIGGTLLLTQDTKTGSAFSVAVVSNDFGASWRTF